MFLVETSSWCHLGHAVIHLSNITNNQLYTLVFKNIRSGDDRSKYNPTLDLITIIQHEI